MAGKVLQISDILVEDTMACKIGGMFREWDMLRQVKTKEWVEVRKYVFATDTSETSNSTLPWKNKTTLPKLCQIRDNLYANYMRSMFPKRKWMYWEAFDKPSNDPEKRQAIEAYMAHVVERSGFKFEVAKAVLDWIDYGNAFLMPEWKDGRIETETHDQKGYVGPAAKRISPLDIVFNPIAASFDDSPKIVRSLIQIGEVKDLLEAQSTEDNVKTLNELWEYMRMIRNRASEYVGDKQDLNELYQVDGFDNYTSYLKSGYCEVLTFYGDFYDIEGDKFYKNHVIKIVDRHKILDLRPNDSIFGKPQIFHAPWRIRQDNLWGMGPLDNLVGMQYRIDHVENLKADLYDLTAFPPLHIKGMVEEFEWGPFARIYSDVDGEVKPLWADAQALNANLEIADLANKMEEMAGAPKEAMGFRTPGEKTMYEVQRLENAAGRIFQSKIELFEELMVEPLLAALLELAKRKLPPQQIAMLDEEYQTTFFLELSNSDITGNGRIRPVAARNFAEKAEKVQNVTAWFNSAVGQDPNVMNHVSGIAVATMMEDLLDLEGYGLIQENIRIQEQSDTMRLANAQTEDVQMEAATPGIAPDDVSR